MRQEFIFLLCESQSINIPERTWWSPSCCSTIHRVLPSPSGPHFRDRELRTEQGKALPFPLWRQHLNCTHYFHSHPTGQDLVTWSYLATREARKESLLSRKPFLLLKFRYCGRNRKQILGYK